MNALARRRLGPDSPFNEPFTTGMHQLFQEFDSLLSPKKFPLANVMKDGDYVELQLALAGYKKEELTLSIESGILSVSGRKNAEYTTGVYLVKGFTSKEFLQKYKVDGLEYVSSAFIDGVLSIRFKEKQASEKKTLAIG